jgi:1-acyl-sn-glycerol-3-phosphate acyltransferase
MKNWLGMMRFWGRAAAATLTWGPPYGVSGLVLGDRGSTVTDSFSRRWGRAILAAGGVEVSVAGAEHAPRDRAVVIMSNHASHLDTAAFFGSFPIGFTVVAKRELVKIPVFGQAMVSGGIIIIDRRDVEGARTTLLEAAERVRNGRNVLIFPEGTRSRNGGLRPFKKGGAILAIEAGVDVLPVSVVGSRPLAPPGAMLPSPGCIELRIHPPVPTAGMTHADRGRLLEIVRERILSGLPPEERGTGHETDAG